MCIGIPMRITRCQAHQALCDDQGQIVQVDISLIGSQPIGTWVLVFLGAAREVMSEQAAAQTLDAISAMRRIMGGNTDIDDLFADLIEREPQLPDFLQNNE